MSRCIPDWRLELGSNASHRALPTQLHVQKHCLRGTLTHLYLFCVFALSRLPSVGADLRETSSEEIAGLGRELRRESTRASGLDVEVARLRDELLRTSEKALAQGKAAAEARTAAEAERERAHTAVESSEALRFQAELESEKAATAIKAAEEAREEAEREREKARAAHMAREEAESRARQEMQKATLALQAQDEAQDQAELARQRARDAQAALVAHKEEATSAKEQASTHSDTSSSINCLEPSRPAFHISHLICPATALASSHLLPYLLILQTRLTLVSSSIWLTGPHRL